MLIINVNMLTTKLQPGKRQLFKDATGFVNKK